MMSSSIQREHRLDLSVGLRSADVLIWDCEGPKRSKGHYMDYEIGSMDGAYKGRLHVAWPFIGQQTLTERQKEYSSVHGFYRARIEHLFARMWHWGIVRNVWRGPGSALHEYVRVLLHLQQFFIRRQVRYPPYGPWEHVPAHVWTTHTQEDNDDEDVVGDDGDVWGSRAKDKATRDEAIELQIEFRIKLCMLHHRCFNFVTFHDPEFAANVLLMCELCIGFLACGVSNG